MGCSMAGNGSVDAERRSRALGAVMLPRPLPGFRERVTRVRNKWKLLVVVAALVGVSGLLVSGLQSGTTYYLTVEEALAREASQPGQRFRIAGNVAPGSIDDQPTQFRLAFLVEDEGGRIPVVYEGPRPDNLQDGGGVVVEGRFQGETFHAETLMVQCASKYEAGDSAEHPTEIPKGRDQ